MAAVEVAAVTPSEKRIAAALQHRFFLRLHMTAILTATLLVGLLVTRILYGLHLNIFAIRYALAVIVAYAAFVGCIKVWIWYVELCSTRARRRGEDFLDGLSFSSNGTTSFSPDFGSGGGSSSSSLSGGGGRFGGGGASGSWGDGGGDSKTPAVAAIASSNRSSGSSKSSSGGGGDDLGELMLVVLIIAVLVAVVASFAWIIYAAPGILSEAAFNAALAGALVKHAHTATHGTWVGGVMKKTAIPFFLILALSIVLGWYAQHYCPDALRLADAMHCLRPAF